ncbi:VrrA/YqfQ family protein [Bacillus sp. 03113]|uniref:VrrA/YqfQ family protein n=1 Tax=Bacillus sp. 03113 TaxID=2578211 RepID=UPI001142C499|nr:VrrA/YqfQ family protein [Bacillus sp. 03113]
MLQRQRGPFQRNMPYRMNPMQGPPPHFSRSPFGGAPRPRSNRGGLLGKLLSKRNQSNAMQGFNAPSRTGQAGGGSILKTLSNPSTLTGFLENTQKVLNTAQQVGPIVQQYGPMFKNIPAMWRLYKGLKSTLNESEEVADVDEKKDLKTEITADQSNADTPEQEPQKEAKKTAKKTGISKPKLYV